MIRASLALAAVACILAGCDSNLTAEQKVAYYQGQAVKIAHDATSNSDVYAMQVPVPDYSGHQTIYIVKGASVTYMAQSGKSRIPVVAQAQ